MIQAKKARMFIPTAEHAAGSFQEKGELCRPFLEGWWWAEVQDPREVHSSSLQEKSIEKGRGGKRNRGRAAS